MSNILTVKRNRSNIYRVAGATFFPGITEIKDEKIIKKVQANKVYKELIKKRVMEEISQANLSKARGEENETSDIAKMPVKGAIGVIRETFALQVLQDMMIREQSGKSRSSVIDAIKDQKKDLKKPLEKKT